VNYFSTSTVPTLYFYFSLLSPLSPLPSSLSLSLSLSLYFEFLQYKNGVLPAPILGQGTREVTSKD
jgi:hypothetical protein